MRRRHAAPEKAREAEECGDGTDGTTADGDGGVEVGIGDGLDEKEGVEEVGV